MFLNDDLPIGIDGDPQSPEDYVMALAATSGLPHSLIRMNMQRLGGIFGDIETIWNEFTGSGVNVGVYDDGVQYAHHDLDGNYDASLHVVDDLGNTVDPYPNLTSNDSHGTAVAGLIAAEANGTGTVGSRAGRPGW